MELRNGEFHNKCKLFSGYAPPYSEINIKTIIPLHTGKLHLKAHDYNEALELIPTLQFHDNPKQDSSTCYFYNGASGNEIRYVSYQANTESHRTEDIDPFSDLYQGKE